MGRPNTTQRSWSNYEGDNPIQRRRGKSPQGEARFYSDSSMYGPGSDTEIDPETGKKKKKTKKLSKEEPSSEEFQAAFEDKWNKTQEESEVDKLQNRKKLRDSMEQMRAGREYQDDSYLT